MCRPIINNLPHHSTEPIRARRDYYCTPHCPPILPSKTKPLHFHDPAFGALFLAILDRPHGGVELLGDGSCGCAGLRPGGSHGVDLLAVRDRAHWSNDDRSTTRAHLFKIHEK